MIVLIINQADTEKKTPTKDQIIQDFAFFILSSFPAESIYIIHPIINEITAITATYFISVAVDAAKNSVASFAVETLEELGVDTTSSSGHHGSHAQFTGGVFVANAFKQKWKNTNKERKNFFINILMIKNKNNNTYNRIRRKSNKKSNKSHF